MNCIRIGVLGSVDTGKSSIIGVLKSGVLDNGKGSIRKLAMKHKHEIESGRTSCISHHNIYINDKLIVFIDLAGHEAYLKTTIYGLNSLQLDYVIMMVGSNMGINKMTKEHFNLIRTIDLPIIFIFNKIDLCPENIINNTYCDLKKLVNSRSGGKKELYIVESPEMYLNENNINTLYTEETAHSTTIHLNNTNMCNNKVYMDSIDYKKTKAPLDWNRHYPLFFNSNKTGYGIDNLKNYLYNLPLKPVTIDKDKNVFIIQETYNVNGVGIVFFGYVKYGNIYKSQKLSIGPFKGKFYNVSIRSVRNVIDQDVENLTQGMIGCIAIKQLSKEFNFKRDNIRKGMYLTSIPVCCNEFIARVHILHHPSTIKQRYQSTMHCGSVTQAIELLEIMNIKNSTDDKSLLRTGDFAKVKFRFVFRPEYIEDNARFIFRENNTKGVGKILSAITI